MDDLKKIVKALPTITVGHTTYLSYQAVTNAVAAFLFPNLHADQIGEAQYQQILETADSLCHSLGYRQVTKLTPPDVPLAAMGLYWSSQPPPEEQVEPETIHIGPGRIEMLEDGLLLDVRLSQLGLNEVTRQHFKIPVTASDAVIDLMHRAVNSRWPNDYKGIWHDLLGMCVAGGREISPTKRQFTVIIRGLGKQRYWSFIAQIQQDSLGKPYLRISLAEEKAETNALFALGHVVMTPGAAELGVNLTPYLTRHARGDWGELDAFDKRQNDIAVKVGHRLLSAYNIPIGDDETAKIWIITEADRSATTILLPEEY